MPTADGAGDPSDGGDPLAAIDDALRALGRELAPALRCGPYLLAHHIASGAVGDIFAATREGDDGEVRHAVKLMRAGPEATETLARFERERNLLRSLAHPAVVAISSSARSKLFAATGNSSRKRGAPVTAPPARAGG